MYIPFRVQVKNEKINPVAVRIMFPAFVGLFFTSFFFLFKAWFVVFHKGLHPFLCTGV